MASNKLGRLAADMLLETARLSATNARQISDIHALCSISHFGP